MSETQDLIPPDDPTAVPSAGVLQPDTTVSDPPPESKPTRKKDVSGLVLVDVIPHDLKCGDYVTLPASLAKALQASGEFDPNAPRPQ